MDMNPHCPNCRADGTDVVRFGSYFRRCDSRRIQRFQCKICSKGFSRATGTPTFRQQVRRCNPTLKNLLCSGVSMRRCAQLLRISRDTVARRLHWFSEQARQHNRQRLECLAPFNTLQFDDLITLEHTKLKPLSVTVVVDPVRYVILDARVSQIPASGYLAEKSRQKYGKRPDQSRRVRRELFEDLEPFIDPDVHVETDGHKDYPPLVKRFFPEASHIQYESVRGCVTGQGELKKTQYDPLFCVNHVLAMMRANISRLIRRTWCTTKKPVPLGDHLALFVDYYNTYLRPSKNPQLD